MQMVCRIYRLATIFSESCAMAAVRENWENMDFNVTVLKVQCDSPSRHGCPSAPGELVAWWHGGGFEWRRMVVNGGYDWFRMGTSGDEWWRCVSAQIVSLFV